MAVKIKKHHPYRDSCEFPHVDILMINSRKRKDWVNEAIMSCRRQVYPDFGLLVLDNIKKKLSIGAAWNMLISLSTAKLVYIIGDDDYITPDTLMAHVCMWQEAKRLGKPVKLITNYITKFRGPGFEYSKTSPTGLWETSWLKANPFNEGLTNMVDKTHFELLQEKVNGGYLVMNWHFGYNERMHPGKVSLINKFG